MISGASQADVALLMVPANKGGFETSIARGNHRKKEFEGQTRQHGRLCHLLGVDQGIVGINKMDTVEYSKDRFDEIKKEVGKMLTKIGYKIKKIAFIPISGYKGVNLTKAGKDEMPWFKGWKVKRKGQVVEGTTLLDALDKAVYMPKRPFKAPLRMPVSGICNIRGIGTVITGRIEQGTLKPKDKVRFYPSNTTGVAFSLQMHHKDVKKARAGDNVGVNVRGFRNLPKTGDVMCFDDPERDPSPPKEAKRFTALVIVQSHPGKLTAAREDGKGKLIGGFTPLVHVRTAKVPCRMVKINWKSGKSTNGAMVEGAGFIEAGDQASIILEPLKPFCVSKFEDCKPLGRIAGMDSNSLIMLGKVTQIVYKGDN